MINSLDKHVSTLLKFVIYIFFIVVAYLSIKASMVYPGDAWIYILFSIVANYLLYIGFRKDHTFFDSFIGVYLWLGFWLKITIRNIYLNNEFFEMIGNFRIEKGHYEHLLWVVIIGMSGLIFCNFLRGKFFKPYNQTIVSRKELPGLLKWYEKYRLYLWIGLLLSCVLWSWINIYFGIYQRGMIPATRIPFGGSGVIKWLVLFGGATFSSVLIDLELRSKRGIGVIAICIAIIETLFSAVSMFSRGMLLNSSALIFGAVEETRFSNRKFDYKKIFFSLALFIILFASSVYVVNFLRHNTYINSKRLSITDSMSAEKVKKNLSVLNEKVSILFLDRWVGTEATMATVSHPDLGWDLFNEALNDKYVKGKLGFYDRVMIQSQYRFADLTKNNFISIPGAIAFFYYSGSKVFLFIAMFLVGWIGFFFERLAFKVSAGNLFLCSIVGQVVAYRFSHFGYTPKQSYLLFGSLLLNMIIIYILRKYSEKKFSKD